MDTQTERMDTRTERMDTRTEPDGPGQVRTDIYKWSSGLGRAQSHQRDKALNILNLKGGQGGGGT